MANSNYVDVTLLSNQHSGDRTHEVDRITPHVFVGFVTAQRGLEVFKQYEAERKQSSCNYVIGKDGDVGLCVEEKYRSWCSSSAANDQRAITIECASRNVEPYDLTDATYNKLIYLCADICRRYGKRKLIWIDDKDTALAYNPAPDEMLLTVHRWFAAKSCPGPWLMERMADLSSTVNALLISETGTSQSGKNTMYRVQMGAFRNKENAERLAKELNDKGYETYIVEREE